MRAALVVMLALTVVAPAAAQEAALPRPVTQRLTLPPPRLVEPMQVRAYDTHSTLYGGPRPGKRNVEANVYREPFELGRLPSELPEAQLTPQATDAFNYQHRIKTSFRGNFEGGFDPADCHVAAGPAHVVTVTNSNFQVWSKTGDSLYAATLDAFLGVPAGFVSNFDPKIVYDEAAQRFYMVTLTRHPTLVQSNYQLAISTTSSALGSWYVYSMGNQFDGRGIDYEELGFGPRALYLSGNYLQFSGWPNPPVNHWNSLWIIDKTALLAGLSASIYTYTDLNGYDDPLYTTKVAQCNGTLPTGVDGFMVGFDGDDANTTRMKLCVYGISLPGNFPTGAPTLSTGRADVPVPGAINNVPQSGGPALLQSNNLGAAPYMCVYRNGHLYTSTHVQNGTLLSARMYDLIVATWPTILGFSESTLSGGTRALFWPSVTANAYGDVGLSFARSGSFTFCGGAWTLLPEDESVFLGDQDLKIGEGYFGDPVNDTSGSLYRWGDYSGAAVDPTNQGFWFYNMYAAIGGGGGAVWRSWVGFVPRAVFVDNTYGGTESGSRSRPWNTVFEGVVDARSGNDLVVRTGTYGGVSSISKPMTIIADGGTVLITP